MLTVILMAATSCATSSGVGEITKPTCPPDSIRELCINNDTNGVYFADDLGGCGDWFNYYGVGIEKDCFRQLDKYWLKLESVR